MKIQCISFPTVCAIAILVSCGLAYGQCDIPRPITSEYLAGLKEIAYYNEKGGGGDECYWQIVGLGLPAVEELIEFLDDPILTQHFVPHWGGHYAVGDIALSLLMNIIQIPVVDLLPNIDQNDFKTMGFGVYWKFVRADPKSRFEVQSVIHQWYDKYKGVLCWKDIEGLQAGGQYVLKPEEDAEQAHAPVSQVMGSVRSIAQCARVGAPVSTDVCLAAIDCTACAYQ